jgi:hypothetical protein
VLANALTLFVKDKLLSMWVEVFLNGMPPSNTLRRSERIVERNAPDRRVAEFPDNIFPWQIYKPTDDALPVGIAPAGKRRKPHSIRLRIQVLGPISSMPCLTLGLANAQKQTWRRPDELIPARPDQ